MAKPFYISALWPAALCALMVVTYVGGITEGFESSTALTASIMTGFAAFIVVVGCLEEPAGRYRFENVIALWTTAFIAVAPAGPAIYTYNASLALLVSVATLVAACCFVHLLERYITAGRKGIWGISFGVLPLGIGTAAALEVGRNDVMAGFVLCLVVLLHLLPDRFWKQASERLKTLHAPPLG